MKLLAVMTESHRELYETHFLPSIPEGLELVTHQMNLDGDGSYESGMWQTGVVQKLKFASKPCRREHGFPIHSE